MGSYVSALVSGLEDLDLVICCIPLCDIPELFSNHTTRRLRRRAEKHDILGPTLRSLLPDFAGGINAKGTAHKLMIVAGSSDRITPQVQANKLSKVWHTPINWFPGGHISYFWARPALQKVYQQLRAFAELKEASR